MNKTRKQHGIMATIAIIAIGFALATCDDKDNHTHEWEWVETTQPTLTADGEATETCKTCGATSGNTRPIAKLELENKTFPITLQDGALVFTVAYKALPTDVEPAYLEYLQTRLEAIVENTANASITAVNNLIAKGSSYTITVEYANTVYEGIKWNATTRTFEIHNDWISTAPDTDLSLAMLRNAFNTVEAE